MKRQNKEWRAHHSSIGLAEDGGKKRAKSETREITQKYVDALAQIAQEGDFIRRQSKPSQNYIW